MYLQAFFVRCLDIFSLENDLHELCYSIELNLEFIKGIKIGALSTSHNIVCVLPPLSVINKSFVLSSFGIEI